MQILNLTLAAVLPLDFIQTTPARTTPETSEPALSAAEAAGQVDPAIFELPGESADPGMTLRPLHYPDIRQPGDLGECAFLDDVQSPMAPLDVRFITDKRGGIREVELLDAQNLDEKAHSKGVAALRDCFRSKKVSPAMIDKSPTQVESGAFIMQHQSQLQTNP